MAAEIPARFADPSAAREQLEKLRWSNGRRCPHCGVLDKSAVLQGKSTRPGLCWCNACQQPFSVTLGTTLEHSKVPLNLWLYATHLLCNKIDISGHALSRMLGV